MQQNILTPTFAALQLKRSPKTPKEAAFPAHFQADKRIKSDYAILLRPHPPHPV